MYLFADTTPAVDIVNTGMGQLAQFGIVGMLFAGSLWIIWQFVIRGQQKEIERLRILMDQRKDETREVYGQIQIERDKREELLRETLRDYTAVLQRVDEMGGKMERGLGAIQDHLEALGNE